MGRFSVLLTGFVAGSVALAVLAAGSGVTRSGWAKGVVANSTDTALGGSLAVKHSYGATTCTSAARTSTTACSGGLPPQASPGASLVDTITNAGDVSGTETVRLLSCAPVRLANALQAADPMLPRNGVAFHQPDPWAGTSAVALSGSGYATDLVGDTGSGLLGALQNGNSIGVWFKPADASGGGLVSLDASLSNATSGYGDPMIWLDSSGNVRFAASGTLGPILGTSTHTFTSGWHLAVLTVNTTGVATLTKTVTLYIDGAQEATAAGLTLLTGSSGYWHLGWGDFTGLTPPSSTTFHGGLAAAFVNPSTALTAGQVSTLSAQTSASAYQSTATTQGAGSVWMLADDGVTTYAGALPGAEATPCSKVNATLTFAGPAATIGPLSLAGLADGSTRAVGTLGVGAAQTLTTSSVAGTGYSSDLKGLHLYVPISFGYSAGASPGWTQTMTWSGDPAEVFWG